MTAQVLLWHAEVEAEGISIPAGLSGLDPRVASAQLEQAREQFRQACVRVHREYAPTAECRHYNRLLDISLRRGGVLIPDIQVHLSECSYCRFAADQLRQSGGRLGVLLGEALLGGAAGPYLDSRPGRRRRARTAQDAAGAGPRGPRGSGRHSRGGGSRALRSLALKGRRIAAAGTAPGALTVGAAAAVTGLLVITLASALWQDDDSQAGPSVPSGAVTGTAPPAPGTAPPAPGAGTPAPTTPTPDPTATSANHPAAPLTTRLRNAEAGLCLDITAPAPQAGTEVTMAACSSAATQRWVYESDGRLRSSAAPALCLNSHGLDGIVVLDGCTSRTAPDAVDVRYDLTIQGQVIPRWNDRLAMVPASTEPGANVAVKIRDESPAQVWQTDASPMGTRQQSGTGQTAPYAEEVNGPPAADQGCEPCPAPPAGRGAVPGDPGGRSGAGHGVAPEGARDAVRGGEAEAPAEGGLRRVNDPPPDQGMQQSPAPPVTAVVSRSVTLPPPVPAGSGPGVR
ncbi:ricin-type beta-trefoil lectin domain protein [Streptomyces sp. OZ13]|uniref:RICIN domain-containing protein n=1 Tax=Streptomyces sp. OZ13 TaxID=3452210 RepID=UPI003F8A3D9A